MTSTLESRLKRIAEVLLHAERGVSPVAAGRLRNRSRPSRRSLSPGMSGYTGDAEQVEDIIDRLPPDDLAALVGRLNA